MIALFFSPRLLDRGRTDPDHEIAMEREIEDRLVGQRQPQTGRRRQENPHD